MRRQQHKEALVTAVMSYLQYFLQHFERYRSFYITSKFSKASCKIAAKAIDMRSGKLQDSEPHPVGLAVVKMSPD